MGLYNKKCNLKIVNIDNNNETFRVIEANTENQDFDIISISILELIKMQNITSIDILKLDIEGAEKYIFDSTAEEWISRVKVIIFECPDRDSPGTTMNIFNTLKRNNWKFRTYIHGENFVMIRDDIKWDLESNLFL